MSASSLGAFRAAVVRSVWSSKMPLGNTPVVLHLLDGPVSVDPAIHIVSTRFRLVRRYLAHRPLEVSRIYRMLHLVAHRAPGHGPVHLLPISAAEIGFVLDGEQQGWIRAALPPLGCLRGRSNIFRALVWMPGSSKLVLTYRIRKAFGVLSFWISADLHNYLSLRTHI